MQLVLELVGTFVFALSGASAGLKYRLDVFGVLVLSFVTAMRTQEIGIRAALGASRVDLLRMVIGNGATPVVAGIVLGLAGAMALARFLQSMLFQTSPIDAPSLVAVSALFLAVALAACFVPAWRAARIDHEAVILETFDVHFPGACRANSFQIRH